MHAFAYSTKWYCTQMISACVCEWLFWHFFFFFLEEKNCVCIWFCCSLVYKYTQLFWAFNALYIRFNQWRWFADVMSHFLFTFLLCVIPKRTLPVLANNVQQKNALKTHKTRAPKRTNHSSEFSYLDAHTAYEFNNINSNNNNTKLTKHEHTHNKNGPNRRSYDAVV